MATNGTSSQTTKSAFDQSSTIPFWLDGKEVKGSSTFDVISPVDKKVLYKCSSASEDDAHAAIAAAEKAFVTWSKVKPTEKRDIFLRAADEFARRRDELREIGYGETGEAKEMFGFEMHTIVDACKSVAGLIQCVNGTIPTLAEEGQNGLLLKEPYGVVYAIAPWNAPYILGLRACLQPLAVGNTVVLKGPEAAPGTYWALASVLHNAGLPAGCLNTIYHRPADAVKITTTIISHPTIKKINFTGSTAVGASIAAVAGKNLKPVVMELGGKAPSIVCEDANIALAAKSCAMGAFLHAGQICMSTERIIVHEKVEDQFRKAIRAAMDEVFSEKGMGVPQLFTDAPVEKNKKLISDAISKGAKAVYGDPDHNEDSKTRMKPVIIEHVKEGMDIYHTESFGPTVSILVVKSDEEALRIANDTDYGLSSSVFTEDLRRGIKLAKGIETGAVHINSMSVHDESALPHGGAKKSGFGRFNGVPGLEEWTRSKVITWKD